MKTAEEILNENHYFTDGSFFANHVKPNVLKAMEEYASQFKDKTEVKNLVKPDVSGNEALLVAFAFAKWIGRKLEKDSWFSHRDSRWYVYLHGHLTTEELFELYEQTGKSK